VFLNTFAMDLMDPIPLLLIQFFLKKNFLGGQMRFGIILRNDFRLNQKKKNLLDTYLKEDIVLTLLQPTKGKGR